MSENKKSVFERAMDQCGSIPRYDDVIKTSIHIMEQDVKELVEKIVDEKVREIIGGQTCDCKRLIK